MAQTVGRFDLLVFRVFLIMVNVGWRPLGHRRWLSGRLVFCGGHLRLSGRIQDSRKERAGGVVVGATRRLVSL